MALGHQRKTLNCRCKILGLYLNALNRGHQALSRWLVALGHCRKTLNCRSNALLGSEFQVAFRSGLRCSFGLWLLFGNFDNCRPRPAKELRIPFSEVVCVRHCLANIVQRERRRNLACFRMRSALLDASFRFAVLFVKALNYPALLGVFRDGWRRWHGIFIVIRRKWQKIVGPGLQAARLQVRVTPHRIGHHPRSTHGGDVFDECKRITLVAVHVDHHRIETLTHHAQRVGELARIVDEFAHAVGHRTSQSLGNYSSVRIVRPDKGYRHATGARLLELGFLQGHRHFSSGGHRSLVPRIGSSGSSPVAAFFPRQPLAAPGIEAKQHAARKH